MRGPDTLEAVALESLILFETPEQIFTRVFRELKPRTAAPAMSVEFCRFANANSFIRLEEGVHPRAHYRRAGWRARAHH